MTGAVASSLRRLLQHLTAPLRHDPAWFQLASTMGVVGWAALGLLSSYSFDDWPSMRFISAYIGDGPLYLALGLGIAQGLALFGGLHGRRALLARMVTAFLASWWWIFLGLGIARSLPGLNPHVALYVVMGVLNLMTMVRLMQDQPRDG